MYAEPTGGAAGTEVSTHPHAPTFCIGVSRVYPGMGTSLALVGTHVPVCHAVDDSAIPVWLVGPHVSSHRWQSHPSSALVGPPRHPRGDIPIPLWH